MLNLDEDQRHQAMADLNEILEMVDKLKDCDTEGIEPLTHISQYQNTFRKDEVRSHLSKVEALKNAASKDSSFFKVPKVVKK